MKRIDYSETGIHQLAWSPDEKYIAYVKNGNEICTVEPAVEGEPAVIANGSNPGFNRNNEVVFEKDDEIYTVSDGKERIIVGINDIISNTPKRRPKLSCDGKKMAFVVENVFHKESQSKNAYPYRSFLGVCETCDRPDPKILEDQQWYGGTVTWAPRDSGLLHFEYDSTGGARIHIMASDYTHQCTLFGLFPSISPDLKRIACKPRGGQNVVVFIRSSDRWHDDEIETKVCKLPEGGKLSGNAPMWQDNRSVIIDEAQKVFRVDTVKNSAKETGKIPVPTLRGSHTMAISPSRDQLAVEVETENGFELKVASLL